MKKEFRIGDKIHVEYEIYDIKDGTVYGYCPGSTTRTGVCLISTALNIVKHIPAPYTPQLDDLVFMRTSNGVAGAIPARVCGFDGDDVWCKWSSNHQYFTAKTNRLVLHSREVDMYATA